MTGFLTANDTPGRHAASWYARTANPFARPPRLEASRRADVCIVGGGFTGVSAALELAERGVDVVLLEANRIGWGASGRNGGQLGSGQRRDQGWLEKVMGPGDAHHLWQVAEDAKALVKQRIEQHAISCDLRPGILHVTSRRRNIGAASREAEHLSSTYGYDALRVISAAEISDWVGSPCYHEGLLDMGAGHLHPLNLVQGLAEAARIAGATLHEMTPVTRIEHGDCPRARTPTGDITADTVIIACNGYLDALVPQVAAHIMPINNFIVATEPLDDATARSVLNHGVAVADDNFVVNYFRLASDNRLLFGGGETYSRTFPHDIEATVRKPLARIFPQLADVAVDYAWGGTLAITMQRMPHFARVAPNVLTAGGFSGHGVALANLAGKILAEAVARDTARFDLMARAPSPAFPGGTRLRHPLLVLAMNWYALRDRLGI